MTVTVFSQMIIYWAIYSILGWMCEVLYCSIPAKKFINRGFLNGPYCPMYGIGAGFILLATLPLPSNPIIIFIASMIVTTVLEYFTGWLMEVLFQVEFWNYSNEKFNLDGRICLKNSILFGLLGVLVTYILHPTFSDLVEKLDVSLLRLISSVILFIFFIDLTITLNSMLKLSERIRTLKEHLEAIESYDVEHKWFDRKDLKTSLQRLNALAKEKSGDKSLTEMLDKLNTLADKKIWNTHLLKAFPKMHPHEFETLVEDLRSIWKERKLQLDEKTKSFKSKALGGVKKFGHSTAEATKEGVSFFASGKGLYKLFWVFVTASVLGYAVETVFALVTRGVLESRQGLVYGPFSQIYGVGAVIMVIVLTPLAKKGDKWLFTGSAIIGGAFEYLVSIFQELAFGTVSWNYSDQTLSIGGRTSITYMLFWGFLGLWFMRKVYPRLSSIIERIPIRIRGFLTLTLVVVLSVDIVLTVSALDRWNERHQGIEPSNAYEEFIDKEYTDEVLQEIYPSMKFVE